MKASNSFAHPFDAATLVRQALCESGYAELNDLRVTPTENGVRLTGVVRTWHLKQMAQTVAMSAVGVGSVDNQTKVQWVSP